MTLRGLVATFRYKPGWRARITGPGPHIWWPTGAAEYLEITFPAIDSGDLTPLPFPLRHEWPVPAAEPAGGWDRWLLDRVLDAEHHEAMEFFQVNGTRPFYPDHGGTPATLHEDLYAIKRRRTV